MIFFLTYEHLIKMFLQAELEDRVLFIGCDIITRELFVSDSVGLAMPFTLTNHGFIVGHEKNNIILNLTNSQCLALTIEVDNKQETYKVSIVEKMQQQAQPFILRPVSMHTPCNYLEQLYHDGIVITDFTLNSECLSWARSYVHNLSEMRSHCIETLWQMMKLIGDLNIRSFVKAFYQGKRCHLSTFSSVNLRKEDPQEGWHVDWPYHTMNAPFPSETLGLQCMILLDDFTKENGATYFVRGSHTSRKHVCGGYENERIIANKGTVVFWLGKLWHCGGKNTMDFGRAALLANFSPEHVPAKHDLTLKLCDGNFGYLPHENKCFLI